jgi:hypothetical protein
MQKGAEVKARFSEIYEELKAILKEYESDAIVKIDNESEYSLNTLQNPVKKGEGFFGAVQIRKQYVSFHLMPVYVYPALLDEVSEGLKKRMQGKSCFNFKRADFTLLQELKALTKAGFESYRKTGWLG